MTYFIITIVATSCAKFNIHQLKKLRDVGLISPFVLTKKQLEKIRDSKSDENGDDEGGDDDDDFF